MRISMKTTTICIAVLIVWFSIKENSHSSDIHIATQTSDLKAMSEIVAKRGPAAVNEQLVNGITPLHIAAAINSKQSVAFLLAIGAEINAKTTSGFTPLHWAANKDSADSAELLISMGADVNSQSNKGLTPLHWAANHNSSNVVKLLIMSGADIYKTTSKGYKPLHWAVMEDSNAVYPMLLFKEASDKELLASTNKTAPQQHLDEMDWNRMLAESDIPSKEPLILEGEPRAMKGESLTINLGHEIDISFVWIDDLDMWFGKYEVTNDQYKQFKPNHSSLFRERFNLNSKRQPAVYISWKQAKIFCTWLNRRYTQNIPDGYEFRLPTDDEWMHCAQCGKSRAYPWGKSMPPAYGNYSDESLKNYISDWKGLKGYTDGFIVSCNVEESGSNEWGVFGMAGNVWEWCEDWNDKTYRYKTLHGGSWDYDEKDMIRIDSKGFDRPDTRDDTIGVRIVIAPK